MDPNNVLIRCPAGHELQAARDDLGKALSCPVCNITFTPGGVPEAAAVPQQLGYASSQLGRPVSRPGYVGWMVGLWVALEILSAINSFTTMTQDPMDPSLPMMAVGCFAFLVLIAAVVLQLKWIHRIHQDARQARGYTDVSPGLALGLSFIPFFNLIWTGWTLKKLAAFAAKQASEEASETAEVLRVATTCFYFGIAKAVGGCVGFILGFTVGIQSAMQTAQGVQITGEIDPFAAAGTSFWAATIVLTLVSVVLVVG